MEPWRTAGVLSVLGPHPDQRWVLSTMVLNHIDVTGYGLETGDVLRLIRNPRTHATQWQDSAVEGGGAKCASGTFCSPARKAATRATKERNNVYQTT